MFSLDTNKLEFKNELASGASGEIYPFADDDRFVFKRMDANQPEQVKRHVQEIVLGFSFSHPHVMHLESFNMEYKDHKWYFYLKMPKMDCNLTAKLKNHISNKEKLPEHEIIQYFYALTCALEYLHDKGVAHCDLKPDNILFDKNNQLKIADIGISQFFWDDPLSLIQQLEGTYLYQAPEITEKKEIKKIDLCIADLWSLGVVMMEICLLELMIFKEPPSQKTLNKKLEELQEKGYSKILIELISGLLQIDPSKRKSLYEVKQTLKKSFPHLLKEMVTDAGKTIRESQISEKFIEEAKSEESRINREPIEILKEFQENWKKEFKIKIDVEKNFKFKTTKDLNLVDDSRLMKLMQDFTQVKNSTNIQEIKQLEINLLNCAKITDDGVNQIAQNIGFNFENVQKLTIALGSFLCEKITDASVMSLGQQINSNLKNLQELELSFFSCRKITDIGIKELARLIGSNLKNLKKLELNFDDCYNITDDGLNKLAEEIGSKLKKLQQLSLNFSDTRVSGEAKKKLKDFCTHIPSVKIY